VEIQVFRVTRNNVVRVRQSSSQLMLVVRSLLIIKGGARACEARCVQLQPRVDALRSYGNDASVMAGCCNPRAWLVS
jgi:hypothetical protein